jgi:hypothetical protein
MRKGNFFHAVLVYSQSQSSDDFQKLCKPILSPWNVFVWILPHPSLKMQLNVHLPVEGMEKQGQDCSS